METKRNIGRGIASVFGVLAVVIFVVIPIVINILDGEQAWNGVLGGLMMALIVVVPVIVILGAVPFLVALVAIEKRRKRHEQNGNAED